MQYFNLSYLLAFLPCVVLFYTITPKKHKWIILLFFSYIFFFLISKKLIIYLILVTFLIYSFGLWIDKIDNDLSKEMLGNNNKKELKAISKKRKIRVVVLATLLIAGILIVLKYTPFIGNNINYILHKLGSNYQLNVPVYLLPIGISFYTLEALSYIYDVYNKKIKADRNLGRLALYLAFFPSIMEGPISRYNDIAESLYSGNKIEYKNLTFGIQRILWGLMKKLIVADRLNACVSAIFDGYHNFDGGIILIGAIFYTIQLYMDFSGTIDIVIGSGEIFGVKLPDNFRQPFFSRSISDFWTRWHITLGTWLRDYVFYPLSLSKKLRKLTSITKKPILAGSIALFVVWLINGFWHGAGWNYIFFGMYHFVLILTANIITPYIIKLCTKLKINRDSILYKSISIIKTTILVIIGEMFFRANSLTAGLDMFKKIFTDFNINNIFNGSILKLHIDVYDLFIILVVLIIVFVSSVLKEKNINIRELVARQNIIVRWFLYYSLILFVIIFGAYGVGYKPVNPIYANF